MNRLSTRPCGQPEDVTQAAVLRAVPANDEEAAFRGLVYWGTLIGVIAPGEDIGPWVVDQMEEATPVLRTGENYTAETVVAGCVVSFSAIPFGNGVMMTLTISAE